MTERAFKTNKTPLWGWPLNFRHIINMKENPTPYCAGRKLILPNC